MKTIAISDLKLLEILNRIPFFKQFTVSERKAFFAASLSFLQCRDGENIISEGDENPLFYILLSGIAHVYVNFSQDRVATLKAGYFIGESAFVMNRPHSATVKADGECYVVRMDQQTLRRLPASVREKLKDQIINGMALRLSDMNMRSVERD